MLTKPELTSPMGAIRYFSALSRGVKVQVLINFSLEVAVPVGGPWSLEKRKLHLRKVIC